MRNVSESTITQAVVHSFDGAADPRFRQIIESLTRHLHAFAREVDLTPQEWKAGIDFLYQAGRISDPDLRRARAVVAGGHAAKRRRRH
jgi:hypothetical protein